MIKKLILAYFPIVLTLLQLSANILYFVNKEYYIQNSFYISNTIGGSLIFSLFLVLYTSCFKFCSVSKLTAYMQLIIAVSYLVIQNDNIYNIIFQTIIMILALIFTFYLYIKKNPNCAISLYLKARFYTAKLWEQFLLSLSKHNFNCERALNDYQQKRKLHYDR